jgi:hypothetical protein
MDLILVLLFNRLFGHTVSKYTEATKWSQMDARTDVARGLSLPSSTLCTKTTHPNWLWLAKFSQCGCHSYSNVNSVAGRMRGNFKMGAEWVKVTSIGRGWGVGCLCIGVAMVRPDTDSVKCTWYPSTFSTCWPSPFRGFQALPHIL